MEAVSDGLVLIVKTEPSQSFMGPSSNSTIG